MNKAERIHFWFTNFLRLTLIIAILPAMISGLWSIAFLSILAFALTFLPAIIEKNYKIDLPLEFELIIVLFVYGAIFLGEVKQYYIKFWWWDAVLHIGSGLALGVVGFLILYTLYTEKKIKASPFIIVMFSFCFSMAIGGVWEIFEFGMDQGFGLDMQKSGLVDTMWDLIVDGLGALFASILGYIYLKGGKTRLFETMIEKFICHNPSLFKRRRRKKGSC